MPIAPTGDDVTAVYTTAALIEGLVGTGFLTSQSAATPPAVTPSNAPPMLSPDDLTDMILMYSREIDGELSDQFATPFPSVSSTGPRLPHKVRDICTMMCAERIAARMQLNNRKAPDVQWMDRASVGMLNRLKDNPNSIGIVQVRTPEDFQKQCGAGSPYSEVGRTIGPFFRLKNRNVIPDSVRFARADGSEAFRPDGYPFGAWLDWGWVSAAEGVIGLYNESGIESMVSALGPGGGVIYDWTWVRLDYGTTGQRYPTGVMRR